MLRTLAAALLGLAGTLVMAGPARSDAGGPAACRLNGVGKDSWCVVDGVHLHLVDHGGQGPPLILLAGLTNGARIFDDFAPRLRNGHHVYAMTRRGFGLSDQPGAYSMALLVQDVCGVMDGLGIGRADIVGHSIAGGEMTALAAAHPERVRRLVYLDAAYDRSAITHFPPDPSGSRAPTPAALASFETLSRWRERQLGVSTPAVAADLAQTYMVGADGRLISRTPAIVTRAVSAADRADPPAYARVQAAALALYAPKDDAEQIAPEADAARREAARRYSLAIARPWMQREKRRFLTETRCARAYVVPGASHYMFLKQPRQIARHVLRFLDAPQICPADIRSERSASDASHDHAQVEQRSGGLQHDHSFNRAAAKA